MPQFYNLKKKLLNCQFFFFKSVLQSTVIKMFVLSAATAWIIIENHNLLKTILFLKTSFLAQTIYLIDIIVSDNPAKKQRYVFYYNLQNNNKNFYIYLTLSLKEGEKSFSLQNFYTNANWIEREIWDMFGIYIDGNKDLRMLLSDYATKANPLKKTYPLTGYSEIAYNNSTKKLNSVSVQLAKFRAKM